MNRPVTTLFMLMSVDGKISTGATDDLDVDKDFPRIAGLREGLPQYYEIEQTTDLWSLNSGRVQAKIGVNTKETPNKTPVSFVIIDNRHLDRQGIRYLSALAKELVLVTTNRQHPAFQMEEEKVSYPGDYSTKAQTLIRPEENTPASQENTETDSLYAQTSGGVTFAISQCYADSMSMYLAVSLEAQDGFPQKLLEVSRNTELSYQCLQMETTAVADFGESAPGKLSFDPGLGVESPYYMEGHFLDDSTFTGIIRIDLANMRGISADGSIRKVSILPDHFTYDLNVTGLYVPLPETHSYSNDPVELETISGDWSFSIDVEVDDSEIITKEINLTNENGLGIATVRKSPYEITAELILPEGEGQEGYVIVMTDSAGQPLESRGDYVGIYNTYQRDVSRVTVAVCGEETFMNYKGDFGTLLSKALFKTEVSF